MMFHLRGISMALYGGISVLRRATVKYTRATTQRGTARLPAGLAARMARKRVDKAIAYIAPRV